jgi:hypothetical protein
MKRLVIHIGYPKTASTTLQANLLYGLSREGRINMLGNHEMIMDTKLRATDRFIRSMIFRRYYGTALHSLLSRENPYLAGLLDIDRVNVWSSEYLSLPDHHDYPATEIPQRLREAFGEDVEYQVVMTTREQSSLLASYYAHFYRQKFYLDRGADSINKWIENVILNSASQTETHWIFEFAALARPWMDVFGRENLHVNMFEDIQKAIDDFLAPWCKLLETDPDTARQLWEMSPSLRVKNTGTSGYHAPIGLDSIVEKHLLRRNANRLRKTNLEKGLSALLQALPTYRYQIDEISPENRARLKARFSMTNADFARMFALDETKLKAYGYL